MNISLVNIKPLKMNADDRGVFTELFRAEWDIGVLPIQWNMINSRANVLRGVHVHLRHWDYLIIASGKARVGLRDLRLHSATYQQTAMLELSGDALTAIIIPPGVAHGFYFLEPSVHIYAVSEYWNLADELGCSWADTELGLDFGATQPHLSKRDQEAESFQDLMSQLEPAQGSFAC